MEVLLIIGIESALGVGSAIGNDCPATYDQIAVRVNGVVVGAVRIDITALKIHGAGRVDAIIGCLDLDYAARDGEPPFALNALVACRVGRDPPAANYDILLSLDRLGAAVAVGGSLGVGGERAV